ncbi:dihydrofolate reductase family protein [Algoriphagus confluentis]|uniref:Dihydrofolate reductase family protein n=1 Tax=Algoriphagus confluentis TaxID=1697556 RepID=A0ABQ6PWP2_9BACT|nr:dihydrofolate reductase family protein [Algoriphagus confluentis]
MMKKNKVFIATSLDGFIADREGGIDWLHSIPSPEHNDMGYSAFISGIDALVMGRTTFETVCGFDIPWPYTQPVFVLSNSLSSIPDSYSGKAELVRGSLQEILSEIHAKGYFQLYIDGGKTIQSFLKEDLIDELTLTTIPVLLGGGIPLFSELPRRLDFACVESKLYLDKVAQNRYIRMR